MQTSSLFSHYPFGIIEFKLLGFYITRLSHSIMFYYIFACNLLGNIIEILLEALAVSLLFY